MKKYKTKYFGELTVDETSDYEYFDLSHNNETMYISLSGFSGETEKTSKCMEITDRYEEIHETAKKAIAENFSGDEVLQSYFKLHFDSLDEKKTKEIFGVTGFNDIAIETIAEKLACPNLVFSLEYGDITLSVDYMVSKEYSDEVLCVKMNEDLIVLDFAREN
jgi:hypothetical protein